MNIFVLDKDIKLCAQAHVDRHVIKMILEYAQLLCTASVLAGTDAPYGTTHINHPCSKWARESLDNWLWLKSLTLSLNQESKHRYPKYARSTNKRNLELPLQAIDHKSALVVMGLKTPSIPSRGLTPFAQAMPEEYRGEDAIEAYRRYYRGGKQHLLKWTNRKPPTWISA